MESKSDKMIQADKNESTALEDLLIVPNPSKTDGKVVLKRFTSTLGDVEKIKKANGKGGEKCPKGTLEESDASGDVNMEASITTDDVIRAGGFGARDDISSFVPVGSDSTDFEASIRNA